MTAISLLLNIRAPMDFIIFVVIAGSLVLGGLIYFLLRRKDAFTGSRANELLIATGCLAAGTSAWFLILILVLAATGEQTVSFH